MPRFRRKMAAPIVSIKHFVARTNTGTALGVAANLDVIEAVAALASATTTEVIEGASIRAVRIELWFAIAPAAPEASSQVTFIIEKVPAGQTPATLTNLLNLQAYLNKKNILYTFQGLAPNLRQSNPVPFIREWVLIPKGKQRFGLGDKLVLSFVSVSQAIQTCGMFIYKEYR